MYAIIKDGGKQYTISPGQAITVEKKDYARGKTVDFPEVIYYRRKDDIRIGTPHLNNVKVEGVVEKHFLGPKIRILKYRRREDSRQRRGHRQRYTTVRISRIIAQ